MQPPVALEVKRHFEPVKSEELTEAERAKNCKKLRCKLCKLQFAICSATRQRAHLLSLEGNGICVCDHSPAEVVQRILELEE